MCAIKPVTKPHCMTTEHIPFKGFCGEAEVSGLADYLASPIAEYIVGQTIHVDSGLTTYW
jgi:enoyl-[acyl-carrier-protein] reductase (NADH)